MILLYVFLLAPDICHNLLFFQVTDTGMTGSSDQIKEDMRLIGDLAIKKMEAIYHPHFEREASTATTAVLSGIGMMTFYNNHLVEILF